MRGVEEGGVAADQVVVESVTDRPHVLLVGSARGQSSLMLYTTTPEEYMRRLTADFEKKHAVKVNIWRARSEAISQRVISEASGSHVREALTLGALGGT